MKNPFRKLPKQCWFLICVTPWIVESCITAATPPSHLLNPAILILLTVVYGVPILFLREIWVRNGLPLRSLFLFGIIYGLLNEGMFAHTITQTGGEPLTHFIGYDEAFGIHWGWASFIAPWHAFFSVTFMVLLTHLWFPEQAKQPWLTARGLRITGILNILLLALYFIIRVENRPAPPHAMLVYLAIMALFYWWAKRIPDASRPKPQPPTRRALILSAVFATLIPALVTIAGFELAHSKIPLAAYFAFTLGISGWIFYRLGKLHPHRLLAFMLGGTLGLNGFAIMLSGDPLYFVTAPAFWIFLFFSMKKLLRA